MSPRRRRRAGAPDWLGRRVQPMSVRLWGGTRRTWRGDGLDPGSRPDDGSGPVDRAADHVADLAARPDLAIPAHAHYQSRIEADSTALPDGVAVAAVGR